MASIGGCGVAAFEEKGPRGLDDRSASQAGTRLAARAAGRGAAPYIGAHSCETNTLKMRVLVSINFFLYATRSSLLPQLKGLVHATDRDRFQGQGNTESSSHLNQSQLGQL